MKMKKPLSVALSAMMAMGVLSVPFTAEAATTNKITVTSNVTSPVSYNYDSNSDQITVTYKLRAENYIVNTQGYLKYDSSVLKLADTTKANCFPVLAGQGSTITNFNIEDRVLYNSTDSDFYDFKSSKVFATFTFDIVGTGNTTVDLEVQVLTANTNDDPSTATEETDVDLVYFDKQASSGFKFLGKGEITTKSTTDPATINVAVPTGLIGGWNGADFYYNTSGSLSDATVLSMKDTGKTIMVNAAGLKTLAPGNWKVYTLTLTAAQAAEVDKAALVGFKNSNGDGRTGINTNCSVNKASDTTRSKYLTTARKLSELNGKTFVIDGCYYAPAEVNSYKGYWTTQGETFAGRMMYVYAPTTGKGAWDGVELFYGDSATNLKTIQFVKGKTTRYCNARDLTTVESGDWSAFYKTLTLAQINAIDNAKIVGFRNINGKAGRTPVTATYDISRAPTTVNGSYGAKVSIARRAGWRFLITGCSNKQYEASSYTGFWYAP